MLKQQGAEILFLCRKQPGDLIELLEEDYRVLLPTRSSSCDGLEGQNLYEAWLGVSQTQDAKECLSPASAGVHTVGNNRPLRIRRELGSTAENQDKR